MLVKPTRPAGTGIVDREDKSPQFDHIIKAITLEGYGDVPFIKREIANDTILILRVTRLAQKNIEELRKAIEEIYESVKNNGGSMARLGDERVIVTPDTVRIWNKRDTC